MGSGGSGPVGSLTVGRPARHNVGMSKAGIVPTLRYDDAPAAIDWLCRAFGFERHLVVDGEDGGIAHAQLRLGDAMIMLASARDDDYGRLVVPPGRVQGLCTQAAYVVVPDADAHCRRAVAAGADIVLPLEDADYGGRGYSCRDPEGHLWNFGTYDPWPAVD